MLYIDSDEILSDTVVQAIFALKSAGFPSDCYQVRRQPYVFGRAVRAVYPGKSPDYQPRLFRRSLGAFVNTHRVHERLTGLTRGENVDGIVEHHIVSDAAELEAKLQLYTDLASMDIAERGSAGWVLQLHAWTRSPFAFAKSLVLRGGWRDGRLGLTLAMFAYRYTYLKYYKASRLVQTGGPATT